MCDILKKMYPFDNKKLYILLLLLTLLNVQGICFRYYLKKNCILGTTTMIAIKLLY